MYPFTLLLIHNGWGIPSGSSRSGLVVSFRLYYCIDFKRYYCTRDVAVLVLTPFITPFVVVQLGGALPSSLGSLTGLMSLTLNANQLTGEMLRYNRQKAPLTGGEMSRQTPHIGNPSIQMKAVAHGSNQFRAIRTIYRASVLRQ